MNLHLPAAVAATALLLTACSSTDVAPDVADPSPADRVAPVATTPVAITPSQPVPDAETLVHDERATLELVKVTRDGSDYAVTALWRVPSKRGEAYVVAASDDGFATGTYRKVSQLKGLAAVSSTPAGAPDPGTCASVVPASAVCVDAQGQVSWSVDGAAWTSGATGLEGLLQHPVDSLDPDDLAVIGSGDGATLSGFERAARSTDDGASWTTVDLPEFDGHRAYYTGAVVLPDGRLLSLLSQFDDDAMTGPGAPFQADRHHGLFVSDGDDWTTATPVNVDAAPALPIGPADELTPLMDVGTGTGGDPVVWVRTADRLYVATGPLGGVGDGDATSFTEVATR